MISDKILTPKQLRFECCQLHALQRSVNVTNGVFDILHAGHIQCLETAAGRLGKVIVGINSDESVKKLKGPTRPIHPAELRAYTVAALSVVDFVCIFPDKNLEFLQWTKPNLYFKGGDYTLDSLNTEEVAYLQSINARIELMHYMAGQSTTEIIRKIRS